MNKLFTKIATLALGSTMAIGVGVAVGSNNDFKPAHAADSTAEASVNSASGTSSWTLVDGTTDVVDVVASAVTTYASQLRMAANSTLTFTPHSGQSISMKAIAFTTNSTTTYMPGSGSTYTVDSGSATSFTANSGTTNQTVTFSTAASSSVVIKFGNAVRLTKLAVTYEETSSGGGNTTTDTITAADLSATGSSYVSFSVVKTATYIGYSAKNGTNMQFNSNGTPTNRCIATSVSGGKIKSVSVTYGNANSKTMAVKVSNTAYSISSSFNTGTDAGTLSSSNLSVSITGDYSYVALFPSGATYPASVSFVWETGSSSTYTVSYDSNGATTGTVPTDSTEYDSGDTVTVLGNTGSLVKNGYVFSGWNTANDGTGTDRAVGSTFSISDNVTLYAKWVADTVSSLSLSGSMSVTNYVLDQSWNPAGFTVTANYTGGTQADVTSSVSWTYSPASANSTSITSVTATASFGGKSVTSSAQTVSVVDGVMYDLTQIDGFSSWTTTYGSHSVAHSDIDSSLPAASMAFLITNKQSSGVGSTYPCIGSKTTSEAQCLQFTLTETGKKITFVSITFVTRYTNTFPSLYLHKGSGIATSALDSLTMSGAAGDEHTLGCANLNDTVFTVGYNAHQTSSNGAVGIKSISIGLENQASFGTLNHITVTGLPNVVYHVGETYDPTGFGVTAYDAADEASANFKDVTASVSQTLTSSYVFSDSDVPGFDETVQYTEGGNTVSTTYHLSVYALAEYQLVTEAPDDWSGNYLIVGTNSESELGAMNGGLVNPDVEKGYKVVTESSAGVIEAGQELEWTIAPVTGGYSIQGKSGKYIGSLTTNANGMLVSESPLVNTLEYSDDAVIIAGSNSNHYHLQLNTTGDRFRYYATGSVQLYKLVESSDVSDYADMFLEELQGGADPICQSDGSTILSDLKASWKTLADTYDLLSNADKELNEDVQKPEKKRKRTLSNANEELNESEKKSEKKRKRTMTNAEEFRLGVASDSPSASNIAQALALYDYIAVKYNTQLQQTGLSNYNFMNRTLQNSAKPAISVATSNSGSILLVVMGFIALTSVGGYFFFHKKKEN